MNFSCPNCGKIHFIGKPSINLFRSFFSLLLEKSTVSFLCDECGDRILNGYKDTYGIGV